MRNNQGSNKGSTREKLASFGHEFVHGGRYVIFNIEKVIGSVALAHDELFHGPISDEEREALWSCLVGNLAAKYEVEQSSEQRQNYLSSIDFVNKHKPMGYEIDYDRIHLPSN